MGAAIRAATEGPFMKTAPAKATVKPATAVEAAAAVEATATTTPGLGLLGEKGEANQQGDTQH
jgi:hypothetical protein